MFTIDKPLVRSRLPGKLDEINFILGRNEQLSNFIQKLVPFSSIRAENGRKTAEIFTHSARGKQ